MRPTKVARGAGTGGSVPVECCQVCGHAPLDDVLSLGYMPPVNQMVRIGAVPVQQAWFPTNLLHCRNCELVQLGTVVDPVIIFPPEYPYTSGIYLWNPQLKQIVISYSDADGAGEACHVAASCGSVREERGGA